MPRPKKPKPDDYFAGLDQSWIADVKRRSNGFNPIGFKRVADEGRFLITTKSAVGLVPMKPNRQQRELDERILKNRQAGKPTRIIIVKGRQGAGITTGVARVFSGEAFANKGVKMKVSAVQPETLDDIWDTYRTMFDSRMGKITEDGASDDAKRAKAERSNDRFIRVPDTLSRIALINAQTRGGKNLGRGGSVLHWHGSEADYYPDFKAAMKSMMPSLSADPMSIAILETTMNMEASTYFKEFVQRNYERKAAADADNVEGLWDVWFIPWFEMESFVLPVADPDKFRASLTDAELKILSLGASLESIAWRRRALNEQFGGDARDFTEAYPSTMSEALTSWGTTEFFHRDAIEFYKAHTIRDPESRWNLNCLFAEPRKKLDDPRDWGDPHVMVWAPPQAGRKYILTADCADSEGRITHEGSENHAVLLDAETGEQVAEFHGMLQTWLFTDGITELGRWFGNALAAPESNYDGKAVVERMNVTHKYGNMYRRERLDGATLADTEVLGWKTTAESRAVMVDRLRWAFNTRRLVIRSQYLLDQLIDFGRRGGRKLTQEEKRRGVHDDGAIALAIACTIHDYSSRWLPRDASSFALERHRPVEQTPGKKSSLDKRGKICYNLDALAEEDAREAQRLRLRRVLNRT